METEMRLDRGGREDDGGAHAISGGGDARNAVVNCYYAFQCDRSWTGRPVQLVDPGQMSRPILSKLTQPIALCHADRSRISTRPGKFGDINCYTVGCTL